MPLARQHPDLEEATKERRGEDSVRLVGVGEGRGLKRQGTEIQLESEDEWTAQS